MGGFFLSMGIYLLSKQALNGILLSVQYSVPEKSGLL
jgi:hypothetical protein